MIHIRPFEPQDATAVASVILPIQQDEFGIPISLAAQPDLTDIPDFYQRGNGNFWVALAEDRVIGTIGLLDMGHREAALRKMFVSAEYRGKGFGVAQRLLGELHAWCQRRNILHVYLGTTAKFLAAHRFYEKNGYSEIQRQDLPAAFPVMEVDTKFYKLELK